MIRNFVKTTLVAGALLSVIGQFNIGQAGVIPWTYSAIFGPPGSLAQMRAERMAYRNMAMPYSTGYGYASSYGYAAGYGTGYGNTYGSYTVGYSPFDSSNCCGFNPGYSVGYGYAPMSYVSGGCSSCTGCSGGGCSSCTSGCSGPGCAAAVTPAGGMKPQVEPNLSNPPNNANPVPNPGYLDQPKSANPSTFKNEGFNNPGNTDAPGFQQPLNMESRKVPVDAGKADAVKEENKAPVENKPEAKKEEVKQEVKKEETKTETGTVDEIIKQRKPAPPAPAMPETKGPALEFPNPAPIANNNTPTTLVMDIAPSRISRVSHFTVPAVARAEAQGIPATFPSSVIASK